MTDKLIYCSGCGEDVYPEYHPRVCIAMYGSVVYVKGYCPFCGKIIVKDHIVDDEGLHPPKRDL